MFPTPVTVVPTPVTKWVGPRRPLLTVGSSRFVTRACGVLGVSE